MINIETKPVLQSAKLLEHALFLILLTLMVATAVLVIWTILDVREVGQMIATSVGYASATLSSSQGYALSGIALTQIFVWIAVILRGKEIFAALGAGDAGSASIASSQTARLLWIMLIWGIIAQSLATLVTTWNFPEGERAISISLGSAQISTIFAALLATFTSHAFVLGAALWQDHTEVI
ncbi:MAG: hypothetical protein AAF234_20105 [Pseudomonadota bacterium]